MVLLITATMVINLDLAGTAIADYQHFIDYYAMENGLDPTLVAAVILTESDGDARALNPVSGAVGLMQIMPSEAGPPFTDRPDTKALYTTETNIRLGCEILADLLLRKKTTYNALYYYSGGTYWNSMDEYRNTYYRVVLDYMEGLDSGPKYKLTYINPKLVVRNTQDTKLSFARH